MHMRRILAVTAVGGALLLGLAATPATAADRAVPYGRNAPVLISPPVAKWIASSQGEGVMNAKSEITRLRGRGAVAEKSGVKRIRIYDVKLQRYRNGAWETVAQELDDVTDEGQPAHAQLYTPEKRFCWSDATLKRTYRVVQRHAVRRTDNVVSSTRTVSSKNFVARVWRTTPTASSPSCPPRSTV